MAGQKHYFVALAEGLSLKSLPNFGSKIMKWYCCLNETAMDVFGECLSVAMHSALANTTLEPHLIYDGKPNAFTQYLVARGVQVHFHTNSFLRRIESANQQDGFRKDVARGAYLRFDIPLIDITDDVVLYTDVDVIFLREPPEVPRPDILAAAPEYVLHKGKMVQYKECMNSGVMVLNLATFRQELPGLLDFAADYDFYFKGDSGYYDQGALNKYFVGPRWNALPQAMNWRPFANDESDPCIIHLHGTKPYQIASQHPPETTERFVAAEPMAYARSMMKYGAYASEVTATLLRFQFPNIQLAAASVPQRLPTSRSSLAQPTRHRGGAGKI